MYSIITFKKFSFLKMKQMTTRDFRHESYREEIKANVNGHPIFPPHHAEIAPESYRIINIHVCAEGLTNAHFFSNTDPVCVMFIEGSHGLQEYGRTEVCWNILNPLWIRPFTYRVREGPQLLTFGIYDVVCDSVSLSDQRSLGEAQVDLGALLDTPTHAMSVPIENPGCSHGNGILHIHFYDLQICQGSLFFRFSAKMARKARLFFVIQRLSTLSGDWVAVYKSNMKSKVNKAEWDQVELAVQYICSGDYDKLMRIKMYDGKHCNTDSCIGYFDTSLRKMMSGDPEVFQLSDEHGKHVGEFTAVLENHWTRPRLFDYRMRGVQLAAMIAVDFSSTPINQIYSNRLQHTDTGVFSYSAAINDVCDLLHLLTSGMAYQAYGFADFKGENKLISLTVNHERDTIRSTKALLQLYETMKEKTTYPKHCVLTPVFQKAIEVAQTRWREEHAITILVILTNGRFTDLRDAIDVLVAGEEAPLATVMLVMGGRRRDLDSAFRHKHGRITDSAGHKTKRRVISIGSYLEKQVYPDERLPKKLAPAAKKMAREWLGIARIRPPSIVV